MGFNIDPTISLGNIIGSLAAIGSVLVAAWRLSIKLNRMQWKLNMIWKWYSREHGIDDGSDEDE